MIVLLEKLMLALKAMEALIEQKISTLQDTIEGKLSAVSDKIVNPDWNQNDATAADYIENRPFYKVSEGKTIVETQSIDLLGGYLEGKSFTYDETIQIGDQVTVIWDDITYDLTVGEHYYTLYPAVGYYVDRDESYPFTVTFDNGSIGIEGRNGSETINFGIMIPGEYVKIPSEYLPEIEIPEVKQPDWNENDATQSSHILNRPCYYLSEANYIVEPTTLTFNVGSSVPNEAYDFSMVCLASNKDIQLNNDVYTWAADYNYWAGYYGTFGTDQFTINIDYDGCITTITREDTTFYEKLTFAAGDPLPKYIKLNEKYIPNTIARKSDVKDFVKYTGQTLTEEQQMQTRENLGLYYTKDGVDYQIPDWYISNNIVRTWNIPQSDWKQENNTAKDFIKNKPRIGQDYIILTDTKNSYDYIIQMQDGNLVSFSPCSNIEITTMPNKTLYTGEDLIFDPSGMIVTAICKDGTLREVKNYSYEELTPENIHNFKISYSELEKTFTTSINLTWAQKDLSEELIDFEYEIEDNGTYTLTGWKETLNGEPSTEMIIPDNILINL